MESRDVLFIHQNLWPRCITSLIHILIVRVVIRVIHDIIYYLVKKNYCPRGCIVLAKLGKLRIRFPRRLRPHVSSLHRSLIRPPNSFIIIIISLRSCVAGGNAGPSHIFLDEKFSKVFYITSFCSRCRCQTLKNWISGDAFRDFKGVKERKQI